MPRAWSATVRRAGAVPAGQAATGTSGGGGADCAFAVAGRSSPIATKDSDKR